MASFVARPSTALQGRGVDRTKAEGLRSLQLPQAQGRTGHAAPRVPPRKVYVHCQSGVGRAPTMAAAFLLAQGLGLEESLTLLQRARPFVDLTATQVGQLREFGSRFGKEQPQLSGS